MRSTALYKQVWNASRPIVLSVCFFISAYIIFHTALTAINPAWTLRATRGVGKFTFMIIALSALALFVCMQSKIFQKKIAAASFFFETTPQKVLRLTTYWLVFFTLHCCTIAFFVAAGFLIYTNNVLQYLPSTWLRIVFGFFVTFLLAWSEEFIFRGIIFNYLQEYWSTASSMLTASLIFMAAHNITAPWELCTSEWRLGAGLFLLGLLLNIIYVRTGSLAPSMGAHMGLVCVKIITRRIPCISLAPLASSSLLFNIDLRQSCFVHACFMLAIATLLLTGKNKLSKNSSSTLNN